MRRAAAGIALVVALAACRAKESPAPVFDEPVRVNDVDGGRGQSEPSIAVSSSALVAAWIDWSSDAPVVRLARSTDGGATFAASRRIDEADATHPHGQAEPTLAFDGARFALGWIACRPDADSLENHACDVYASLSSDGGATWEPRIAIAEGGHVRRDRPWITIDENGRFGIAWSEVGAGGSRWSYAREHAPGSFLLRSEMQDRAAVQPPSLGANGVEVMLIDRSVRDPRLVTLEHQRVGAGGVPAARWSFPPEAVLLPYSLGAFAANRDGEAWALLPEGTGEDGDFSLLHRGGTDPTFRTVRRIRSRGATRVGLPWITPLGGGRFLAAWADETAGEGWRVRARVLGPGAAVSAPSDVSRAAFRFHEASRTQNVGDFLSAASSGDAFWVAWSDTRDGDADVWMARGKSP